ncbi:hypothetical protein G6O67_007138 [Ophiocordyceps sinensis]|uniref:Uncharacterized protein n=1 Tax=Ophiocordyceps sinensis TaxID=72228 RepID=A0A8H4PIB4_9HYPO|nr:hypothetical protein G6O67_007138 [Ophiocordyceps sinensis]
MVSVMKSHSCSWKSSGATQMSTSSSLHACRTAVLAYVSAAALCSGATTDEMAACISALTTGHSMARCVGLVLSTSARTTKKTSALVVDEGEDVGVAASSSTSLSNMTRRSATKASSAEASTSVAMRRRLSCVLRSASSLADVAPTPKTMPAVVGALMRPTTSPIFSLSESTHCRSSGSQSCRTSSGLVPKNLPSLNASPTSLLHVLWLFCSRDSSRSSRITLGETVSGKARERSAGPRTLVDSVAAAESTRSVSSSIVGRWGTIDAKTETTPSDPSLERLNVPRRPPLSLPSLSAEPFDSANVMGRVVKSAARSRRKRSCPNVSTKLDAT